MSQRWKIFTALALMFTVGFFYRVSMAVLSADLIVDLKLTAAQLGIVSGAFFYAFAFAQLPLGPLIDRHGGRIIISLFGIVTTCGSLLFTLSPGFPGAFSGRVLLGLGTACVLMGSLKIFTNWFTPREFPTISGFMIAAGNVGSVTATAPLALAISIFSWRPTLMVMTVVQAVVTLAVFIVVRDAPHHPDASRTAGHAPEEVMGVLSVWQRLFSSADFWIVALLAFFWYANYMVLLALWGGPYLMEGVGLDRSQSGTILLGTSLGFITGSLLVGRAIRWLGGSLAKTILLGQTLLFLLMIPMLGAADHLSLPVLMLLFMAIGLVSGSGVIIYPLARELVPHRFAATAMTAVNFFLLLGAAVMQHIMGIYISSFPKGPAGHPAAAFHGAFLMPVCGLGLTLILFALRKWAKGFDSPSPQ